VKIGILGGSFNPPHEGHVHISLETLKRFNLSHVFWLVTPCSPTKNSSSYEDLTKRVQKCVEITKPYSNKITILDIKLDKIKDNRKNDVQKEYDLLFEKLKSFIIDYTQLYKTMKKVNLF
jgi:nicotinate-nucleotide adenylyltransferase